MLHKLTDKIRLEFENRFSAKPLLIASPGRINLIGEHTDYNDGFVLPAAIDMYIIAGFAKNNKNYSRVYAMDVDEYFEIHLHSIVRLEDGGWRNYVLGVLAEIFQSGKRIDNFDLVLGGNIPLGAGLSSSAALENSIVFGLNTLFKLKFEYNEMVHISMQAEHRFAGVMCGIMDPYASMNGRKDKAILLDCRSLDSEYIPISNDDYRWVLINSNVKHQLAETQYNIRRKECQTGLSILQKSNEELQSLRDVSLVDLDAKRAYMGEKIYRRCRFVIEENQRVLLSKDLILKKNWKAFGEMLYASHEGLQNLYEVSCSELDFLVRKAKESEAVIGSRMMGGGFGGCTLNLVRQDKLKIFSRQIVQEYYQKFGQRASVYLLSISEGVRVVE
jgi:galactokinase